MREKGPNLIKTQYTLSGYTPAKFCCQRKHRRKEGNRKREAERSSTNRHKMNPANQIKRFTCECKRNLLCCIAFSILCRCRCSRFYALADFFRLHQKNEARWVKVFIMVDNENGRYVLCLQLCLCLCVNERAHALALACLLGWLFAFAH